MSTNFPLKFLAAVATVSLLNVVPPAQIAAVSDSVAFLSFPVRAKKFHRTIDALIKDYDKDSRVA